MLIQLSLILLMKLSSTLKKLSLAQTLAWERSTHYIFMFICTSVIMKSMQRVETCRCVPEDRNLLVYFPPPFLLSFERFTSLNPVSQHNHALLGLLCFSEHFSAVPVVICMETEGRCELVYQRRESGNKRRIKYDNWRELPCGDDNLHLGSAFTGRKLDAQSYTWQSGLCVCKHKRPGWSTEPGSAVAIATHVRARPSTLPAQPIACARFPVFSKALWERLARRLSSPLVTPVDGFH